MIRSMLFLSLALCAAFPREAQAAPAASPKITEYSDRIGQNPNDAAAYFFRGFEYYSLNDYGRAMEDFNKALSLNPKYAEACYGVGIVYQAKGAYARAIESYTRAVELKPDFAEAFTYRGLSYDALGDYDRAFADYDKAIALSGEKAGYALYYNRGTVYSHKGQFDKALADFDKALALNPKAAEVYANRAYAYFGKREFDKALEEYNKVIALNPQPIDYFSRGNVYYEKGETQKAIDDYSLAILRNANIDVAYLGRAKAYIRVSRFTDALQDLDLAMRVNPLHSKIADQVHFYRGLAYTLLGQTDNALQSFSEAIMRNPRYVKAYFNRASVFLKRGGKKAACEDYYKAGSLYAAQRARADAEECLGLIKKIDPRSPYVAKLAAEIRKIK